MKKTISAMMVWLGVLAAQADELEYLTFQTADGTKVSVAAQSLVITFENGYMLATDSNGSTVNLALADLSKMYFSEEAESTAIEETAQSTNDEAVEVFTPTGIHVGNFENLKQAQSALQQGIYVVKSQSKTTKIAIR